MLLRILHCILPLFFSQFSLQSQSFSLDLKIKGAEDSTIHLAYHYAGQQFIKDSLQLNSNGWGQLTNNNIEDGMYLVVLPGNKYFEIIVGDRKIQLETVLTTPIDSMKINGSIENELFFNHIKFIKRQRLISDSLNIVVADSSSSEAKKIRAKEHLSELQKTYNYRVKSLIRDHPTLWLSDILSASSVLEIPDSLKNQSDQIKLAYQRKHHFDGIDFSQSKWVRTAVLHNKVNTYLDELYSQNADSIIIASEQLIQLASANDQIHRYVLSHLLNKYAQSKIMGHDAIYVYLVNHYYTKGKTPWVSGTDSLRIASRAKAIEPTLIGKIAPELELKDSTGQLISMNGFQKKFTVLYFWDPDCGHCKKTTPALKEIYPELQKQNIEVYAASVDHDRKKWLDYIKKYELRWINVADLHYKSSFREDYDITGTPRIFLLDENKKILAKRISVKQLQNFIEHYSK